MDQSPKHELYRQALELAEQGQHETALQNIQQYLLGMPTDAQALNDAGTLLYSLGRHDEAAVHLRLALQQPQRPVESLWNLIEVYLAGGKPQQALTLLPQLAAAELLTPDTANRIADAFLQQSDLGGAVEALLESLRICPQQEILLHMLQTVRNHRPKVAFFCDTNQLTFLEQVYNFLGDRFQVELCRTYTPQAVEDLMQWCDIAWFEWCTQQAVFATNRPKLCKTIIRLHRYEAYRSWVREVNWDNVDALMTVGNRVVQEQIRAVVPDIDERTKVPVIPNGVDLQRFAFSDRPRGKNLAVVAYLHLRKNPMFLLHCFQKLHSIDPGYRIFFAGDWQDEMVQQYMLHMVAQMGLQDCVFFDGHQTDVQGWLQDKHYLLSGSLSESQGMGIMEGMACGLRPVIHDFPGADSIYPAQYIFRTQDEFCQGILEGSYQPREYRQYIEQNYSLDLQMSRINDLFLDLERQVTAERQTPQLKLV